MRGKTPSPLVGEGWGDGAGGGYRIPPKTGSFGSESERQGLEQNRPREAAIGFRQKPVHSVRKANGRAWNKADLGRRLSDSAKNRFIRFGK
jgi:hypothetical protein